MNRLICLINQGQQACLTPMAKTIFRVAQANNSLVLNKIKPNEPTSVQLVQSSYRTSTVMFFYPRYLEIQFIFGFEHPN